MNGDFVSLPVHFLNGGVIGVFVAHEKGALNIATVWIFPV